MRNLNQKMRNLDWLVGSCKLVEMVVGIGIVDMVGIVVVVDNMVVVGNKVVVGIEVFEVFVGS